MFVSPFQGSETNVIHTQGDGNARQARLALPWADMFWPFQGKIHRYFNAVEGQNSINKPSCDRALLLRF